MSLCALSLCEAAAEIREGRISAVELVTACLDRIAEVDPGVQAWTFLDRDHALMQARVLDESRAHGGALGPLHGVPIGVKDVFDTGDMPTEFGSPLWAGRTPRSDAAAVARLRAAGAVIMGKTVTTEYAYFHPGKTRNPHDAARTPGGSSSGSAAAVAASEPPLPPRFAFVKSPVWEQADAVTRDAFGELVEFLGEAATEVELGESFERAIDLHRTVMEVEMAHNLHRDYEKGGDKLSAPLRRIIERGRARLAVDYAAALAGIAPLNEGLNDLFNEYDAILTLAAPGEAPRGLESTGNPIFCTIWTYLGAPAITLPLLRTESGLPLGVQLVGRRGNDARLLRTARWLVKNVERISHHGRRQATVMDSKPAGRAGKRK